MAIVVLMIMAFILNFYSSLGYLKMYFLSAISLRSFVSQIWKPLTNDAVKWFRNCRFGEILWTSLRFRINCSYWLITLYKKGKILEIKEGQIKGKYFRRYFNGVVLRVSLFFGQVRFFNYFPYFSLLPFSD